MIRRLGGETVRSRIAERFGRLSIGQKIYLMPVAFSVVLVVLVAVVVSQTWSTLALNVADRTTGQLLEQAFELDLALTRMEVGARGYSRIGGEEFLGRYHDGKADFDRGIARLLTIEQDPSQREILMGIQRQADQEDAIYLRPLIALREAGGSRRSFSVADNLDLTLAVEVRDAIDAYIATQVADARRSQDDSDAALRTLMLATLAGLLATAAILIPVGIMIGRSLGRRVRAVDQSASAVAEGALDAALPFAPGGDEIDSMARSIKRMADTLRDRIASESAARETAERATRSKDEFFSRAGHELRTPLNAIMGFSELLHESVGRLGDRETRYLGNVRDAGARLQTLFEEVLALADLTAGVGALELQTVELAVLLRPVTRTAAERCAAARGSFAATLPDDPVWVRADVTRLRAALTELIEDAVRSTAPGGTISLDALVVGQLLTLEVFNSGVVPAADTLARWFDPFPAQFAPDARTAQATRVGLLFVRRVVELHGGATVAEGLPGRGTVVRVTLPLADHQPDAAASGSGALAARR